MSKDYKKSIFIFRRDFRLTDNTALIEICKNSDIVIPIFIFDPFQIKSSNKNNNYRSENAIQFMCDSLDDLNKQLSKFNSKLRYFYGNPATVIRKLLSNDNTIDCVSFNKDFSEYSLIRDEKIREVCNEFDIDCITHNEELTLIPAKDSLKDDGEMYLVFSAYFKNARKVPVQKIKNNNYSNYLKKTTSIPGEYKKNIHSFYKQNPNLSSIGGRSEAKKILSGLKKFKNYNTKRDFLNYNTTHLSAYLKFGCVSIIECYWHFRKNLGMNNELIKQLYWRSFYFHISRFFPSIVDNDKSQYSQFIDKRFNKVRWSTGKQRSEFWKKMWSGNTGFLAIDAAVRELNETGFMHNRGRLLVANFSIKILRLDPFDERWGGQTYFAKNLIDCCYGNNVGNWRWTAGDKLDPSGMRFGKGISGRVFDPRNFRKWDPKCEYIKKWIPELKDVPNQHLFNWQTHHKKYADLYPGPFVDFEKKRAEWKKVAGFK